MTTQGIAPAATDDAALVDSGYAWFRLLVSIALSTLGGVGMWSVVVVLPAVQRDFGASRGAASLPFTLTMVGFALGGVLMGRLMDRFGIVRPALGAVLALAGGYALSAQVETLWQFALVQGVLIAMFGSAATFGPLIANVSLFFRKRRGTAVALCASGNYLAGALWPPFVQQLVDAQGWRHAQSTIGLICLVTMLPLLLLLRRRPPLPVAGAPAANTEGRLRALRLTAPQLQTLLCVAAIGCCVAMAMPQVQLVALCGDLGFGAARGAEMLSVMLGLGVVSRIASGFIADRIGGIATLLIGSVLQAVALSLYAVSNTLPSLFVVSALFGLVQGGIVPCYAIIVREHLPAHEAGARVGIVLMASLFGMAAGGWLSGAILDFAHSYSAAFVTGVAWNALNVAIVAFLWLRPRRLPLAATP